MDEIKATPRIEWLGAIVDALRATREKIRPEDPKPGEKWYSRGFAPAAGRFLTDMVLPEEGLEELNDWSHGDLPMHIPEMSNIPQFKSNRSVGKTAEAIGMAPFGALAKIPAKAAVGATALATGLRLGKDMKVPKGQLNMLVPVIGDESIGVLNRAHEAENMLSGGADAKAIWKQTGMHPIQRAPDDPALPPRTALESKFAQEVTNPKDKPLINPDILMSEKDTTDFLHANLRPEQLQHETADEIVKRLRADKPQIIRPGTYEYENVLINHPLLDSRPDIRRRLLEVFEREKGGSLGSSFGDYDAIYKLAAVAPKLKGQRPGTSKYEDTILHELTHYLQREGGAPTGGGSGGLRIPSDIDEDHLEFALYNLPPDLRKFGARMDKNIGMSLPPGRPEFQRYKNIYGEQDARASAIREMGSPVSLNSAPIYSFDNPEAGHMTGEFEKMLRAYQEAQSTNPATDAAFSRAFAAALRARGLR